MATPYRSKGEDDMDKAINEWGYVMSAENYMSSPQRQLSLTETRRIVRGRGRGFVAPPPENSALENVRLAAHINRLDASSASRLRTTDETLAQSNPATEITATLRSLGIRGEDCELTGRTTRRTLLDNDRDIHFDGNIPVILNGELFHAPSGSPDPLRSASNDECPSPTELDPEIPLSIQFPTIDEFYTNNPFRTDHQSLSPESTVPSTAKAKKSPQQQHSSSKKKPKWRKMTVEETIPPSDSRGNLGFPAGFHQTGREVFGADGTKKLL